MELWFHIIMWCHPKLCHPEMVTPLAGRPPSRRHWFSPFRNVAVIDSCCRSSFLVDFLKPCLHSAWSKEWDIFLRRNEEVLQISFISFNLLGCFFWKWQRWSRGHKARGQGQGHKKKSEANAKDCLSEDRPSRGQGQECSRPRTKDTAASVFPKKK